MDLMPEEELTTGFFVGLFARFQQPPDLLGTVIFFAAIIAIIVIGIFFCRDLGQQNVDDTAKVLWAVIFFLLPIISWFAYWFVIKKGRSISKSGKE
ncbi:MAG: hypothetical protein HWN67_06600 [Candidatus Helarchaeota archaeon]|nr:hypothetical protein [Candidatus Helarchaeota archaeon]